MEYFCMYNTGNNIARFSYNRLFLLLLIIDKCLWLT